MKQASRWLPVVVLLLSPALALAQAPTRKTAAVQIYPATATDVEVANQVRKIAVDTLENYRNLLTKRYLTDKDVKLADELNEILIEANRKVSTGMRSKVFDEGVSGLDQAYLKSKGALGELAPDLVGQLYFGLAMAKAVLGNKGLATDYMTLFANMSGEKGRNKVGYNKLFLEIWDAAWARIAKTHKFKVTIKVEPAGALVGIDGKTWGKAPMTAELTAGNHLIQVEAEGYERGGWIKDPALQGKVWKLSVNPYASRDRYLETVARLGAFFAPPVAEHKRKKSRRSKKKAPPSPAPLADVELEPAMAALAKLLNVDYLLFLTVSTEGAQIRIKGAFYSLFGVRRLDETLTRDARIIDSAREILLAASDLEVLKKSLAEQQAAEAQRRLVRWADKLAGSINGGRTTLESRAEQWLLVGQKKKSELFLATAKEAAVLEAAVRNARTVAGTDPSAATTQLDESAKAWKVLEPKVRSLLAWDVERALQKKQVDEIKEMKAATRSGLDELKALLKKKHDVLDKKARKTFARDVKNMEKWRSTAGKLLAKDPLSEEARGLLYRVLLKQAELKRLLSLI